MATGKTTRTTNKPPTTTLGVGVVFRGRGMSFQMIRELLAIIGGTVGVVVDECGLGFLRTPGQCLSRCIVRIMSGMPRQPGRITTGPQLHHVPKGKAWRTVDPMAIYANLAQPHAGENVLFNTQPRRIDLGGLKEEADPFSPWMHTNCVPIRLQK